MTPAQVQLAIVITDLNESGNWLLARALADILKEQLT